MKNYRNTEISQTKGKTVCTLYSTDIVTWDDKTVRLNTGGHKTRTTVKRMNECSKSYGLGFSVFQEKKKLFVEKNGQKIEFLTEITLTR